MNGIHRVYIVLLTGLLALSCIAGWYFIQNEREAILTQRAARAAMERLMDPHTGLQASALARVDAATAVVDRQVAAALSIVNNRSAKLLSILNDQSENLLAIARDTAAGVTPALARAESDANAQLTALNATVADTLKPAAEIAQQLDDAAPLYLDCEFNPDCAFNRFQGVSKAVEKTSMVIAAAAPSLVSSADKIAASSVDTSAAVAATGKEVAIAAHRFNAPPTRLHQFYVFLLAVARVVGAY